MRSKPIQTFLPLVAAALILAPAELGAGQVAEAPKAESEAGVDARPEAPFVWEHVDDLDPHVRMRATRDLAAMAAFRPGYSFWQHVFLIPDGSVAYGSAEDGRLLAIFPAGGDWSRSGRWEEQELSDLLDRANLPSRLTLRRDEVASLLEDRVGPVVHNATRGNFLLPNARRYGPFLEDWGAIYERFGVPAEIGLAQAAIESGLNGRIRSEARALGLCQWLPRNWERLKQLAPNVIEGYNQTTQAAYCAAYLSILAVKYGSFIPALSEHHAGGTNVGRTVINGGRLGGQEIRERYFMGAEFARDLRTISAARFRDVVRTYGPRSFLYAEMVFGNTVTVRRLAGEIPQVRVHAMRTPRSVSLEEIARRTGLSVEEVRRFNPALVRQVPRGATLYLPVQEDAFGPDVAFWHRPADPAFQAVLADFVRLDLAPEDWEEPSFLPVMREFQRRFTASGTEEGGVMAAVLVYVMEDLHTSRRTEILAEYRTNPRILSLVEEGIVVRETFRSLPAVAR